MQVAHDELFAAHRTISADVEALQSRFEEQRALNERLENDLLRINQAGPAASALNAPAREDPLAGLSLGKKVCATSKSCWSKCQSAGRALSSSDRS